MNINDIFYRRDGKKIYIKKPDLIELSYTQRLWNDTDTMADVGKVVDFPRYKWETFYKRSVNPTDGKNFYCLVYTHDNTPIGEVGFHGYDIPTKTARLNIRIENVFRGKGYGKEALDLILDYFFQEFGGEYILESLKDDTYKEFIEKEGFKFVSKNKVESIYRLSKRNYLAKSIIKTRKVGIMLYDGVSTSNVTTVINLFDKINKILNKEIFSITTIGTKEKFKDKLDIVNLNVKEILTQDFNQDFQILIMPSTNNMDFLNDEIIFENLHNIVDRCDIILACNEGVIPLILTDLLSGLMVSLPKKYEEKLKEYLSSSIISDKNIVDNGKIILFNGNDDITSGCLYLIKRLCGEGMYKALLLGV